MSSDKRIYKRYLVENVEMCKRTKQRRDCENESSYDGSGPSQAVERRHSEINREISSDSEEFYSNDNTRESYQASDTDSEDCLTEDDISMDMQCEYEGNNLPFDNDLVQDEELSSNIEEQEENIRLEKVSFILILPYQKSFCFKFNDAIFCTIFIFQYFHIF